ncbi:Ppx-GppA-domain-containing protein [Piedraia hortae CBS 480.64]|uniref:Ppx-GppA-domain-containing protein n=1 Tax=Piedraia hortae CBS 480.64 TaxID=1314780 RepID=A0A6A7C5H6_9PEZI|nr:Ppx-GppA-domain-containing protein [Piedraia hortae CBS 480.64]
MPPNEHLHALIDMGSNGVRLSITSLSPPHARILPTIYQDRIALSLYDAQYQNTTRGPIDPTTISTLIRSLLAFKRTCTDLNVTHVRLIATEATRTASNASAFSTRIREATGWDVEMLSKEDEGRVGALGVASSLPSVNGLVMDLGGGSTQLSWVIKPEGGGEVRMPSRGAVSLPFGAAALGRRLSEPGLEREVVESLRGAYASLEVPEELEANAREGGGFKLYLSGGGFKGWGFVLMARHRVQPYPIPVINGFTVAGGEFVDEESVVAAATASLAKETGEEDEEIFRVSERRARQVPAVAFLVRALAAALPYPIGRVRFCQGGVREGVLFSSLEPAVRAENPLQVATVQYALTTTSSEFVAKLLCDAVPKENVFPSAVLHAVANLMYFHSTHPKDIQVSAALRSTTTGVLANVHGISHEQRAVLALILCQRWGGGLPPTDAAFQRDLERMVSAQKLWWVKYIGAVARLIAAVYPMGIRTQDQDGRLRLSSRWGGNDSVSLTVEFVDDEMTELFTKQVKKIEKVGKKKSWPDGMGFRVVIEGTQRDSFAKAKA